MLRSRNDYLGETLFLLTMIFDERTRNTLHKIYYGIQHKDVYTTELIKLKKIEKAIEAEQERMWNE